MIQVLVVIFPQCYSGGGAAFASRLAVNADSRSVANGNQHRSKASRAAQL